MAALTVSKTVGPSSNLGRDAIIDINNIEIESNSEGCKFESYYDENHIAQFGRASDLVK